MHDPTPVPPDPESERRGHELRDVALKPILFFLIGLFVFGGVLQTVMSLIMTGFIAPEAKIGAPGLSTNEAIQVAREDQAKDLDEMFRDHGPTTGHELLQRDTTQDMIAMYKEEDAVLGTYNKDPKTGKIRVPIDRAIEIVAKKGLPHRDTPKDKLDKTLPYPARSKPYMATP